MAQRMSNFNEGIVLSGFKISGSQIHNRHIILVAKTGQKGVSLYATQSVGCCGRLHATSAAVWYDADVADFGVFP